MSRRRGSPTSTKSSSLDGGEELMADSPPLPEKDEKYSSSSLKSSSKDGNYLNTKSPSKPPPIHTLTYDLSDNDLADPSFDPTLSDPSDSESSSGESIVEVKLISDTKAKPNSLGIRPQIVEKSSLNVNSSYRFPSSPPKPIATELLSPSSSSNQQLNPPSITPTSATYSFRSENTSHTKSFHHGLSARETPNSALSTTSSVRLFNLSLELIATSDRDIITNPEFSESKKRYLLGKAFRRAASNGDIERLQNFIHGDYQGWVDIDEKDEDGATALILSCCFGHLDLVFLLLQAGAKVDEKDNAGWTPLLWACTNGHLEIAAVLVNAGASKYELTIKNLSVTDYLIRDVIPDEEVLKLVDAEDEKEERVRSNKEPSPKQWWELDNHHDEGDDDNHHPDEDGLSDIHIRRPSAASDEDESRIIDMEALSLEGTPMDWTQCLLDQMIVFDESKIDRIIDIAITQVRPSKSPPRQPFSANVLFLCVRYAGHFHSEDLLNSFLDRIMTEIVKFIKENNDDLNLISYWISNATYLLHYLKKDNVLLMYTLDHQLQLTELISKLYEFFIRCVERRILSSLDAAILSYSALEGVPDVKFENVMWQYTRKGTYLATNGLKIGNRLFNAVSAKSPKSPLSMEVKFNIPEPIRPKSTKNTFNVTPQTITSILASSVNTLRSASVHPTIIHKAIDQLFYFISAELFNRVMTTREYCCRTKALTIRMNINILEEWGRKWNHSYAPPLSPGSRRDSNVSDWDGMDSRRGSDASSISMISTATTDHQRGSTTSSYFGGNGNGNGLLMPSSHLLHPHSSFSSHGHHHSSRRSPVIRHLKPLLQLLQFLQILSSLTDLSSFLETMSNFPKLTSAQLRRVLDTYRYEVDEKVVDIEIRTYLDQVVEDQERVRLKPKMEQSTSSSSSMSSSSKPLNDSKILISDLDDHEKADQYYDGSSEFIDPKKLIPFRVPQGADIAGGDIILVPASVLTLLDA